MKSSPLLTFAAWMARHLPAGARRLIYRIRPLARLVRGSLNRAAPHGLTEIQVAAGALQGLTLALDLQTEKDFWLGTYEPELQQAIRDWIRPGMTVFDVGANIGYISLMLARQVGPGGRVVAFEALPENVARLERHLALNQMQAQITVVPAAVVEAERPVRFLVAASVGMGKAEGSAGRADVAYERQLDLAGLSLDGYVYRQGGARPQALKMDIEGGEVLALPGMARLLAEARPLIFLELHGPQAADVAWETLSAAGYRLQRLAPGYPVIASRQALDWKAYLVAVHPATEANKQ